MASVGGIPSVASIVSGFIFGKYDIVAYGDNKLMGVKIGDTICDFDNVLGINVNMRSETMKAPIEGGSFVTYNKVRQPSIIDLTLGVQSVITGVGGAILNKLGNPFGLKGHTDNAIKTLQKWRLGMKTDRQEKNDWRVVLVTPSDVFAGYSINNINYAILEGKSPTLLAVTIRLEEVLIAPGFQDEDANAKKKDYRGLTLAGLLGN